MFCKVDNFFRNTQIDFFSLFLKKAQCAERRIFSPSTTLLRVNVIVIIHRISGYAFFVFTLIR